MNISTPINVRNCHIEECIDFFDVPGFILDDGIYASAFGQFNYIYRAKGIRSIWFKNGIINECTIHSSIDENGFNLNYEEIEGVDLYNSKDFFDENINQEYETTCDKYKDPSFILNKLLNINKYYYKSYYLEYLIDPPDVQILSDYSLELRKEIWNSILELGKRVIRDKKNDELDFFKFCIDFMRIVNNDIQVEQVIDFFTYIIENKSNIDLNLALNLLKELKSSDEEKISLMNEINSKIDSNNKSDILEVKPNIWGIGINFNEVFERIRILVRKKN
ncbi:hypothetical protein [Clostridium gasigenes]|uniref:Uncharacterized protein n=1 Tax=Clostridium gasigenes TaxID=94869 RepID=A0A1H0VGU1_9CLOT|nr:hypothetical protein [Clostridium gasigenes]SDP77438.1 hypothetical protein SAMN04488529_11657 [Clostridium gasigenes]